MKKITLILAIMAALIAYNLNASGQVVAIPVSGAGTSHPDAELLAQAFLLHDTDHYEAGLSAQQWVSNSWQQVEINMILDLNLYITNMTINGTKIPLPKPLGGVPVPKYGYQSFNLNVSALDKFNNVGAHGSLYTNALTKGSRILVNMVPSFPPVAVQLPKGLDQNSIQVNITGSNGWGWSYDPSTGLLTIYTYDPSTDVSYSVTDGSGVLLAHGPLPFFQASPGAGTDDTTVLGLSNAGNIINLPLGPNGYNYANNLRFDSWVTRNGQSVPAKIINIPDVGNSKLYVYVNAPLGTTVEVREWTSAGAMSIVPATLNADSYGTVSLVTSVPVGKAVITILPPLGAANPNAFYVGVFKSY